MTILIKICLWILAFTPLIVDNSVFFPFSSGKNLLIETSLMLTGILIAINFIFSSDFRKKIVEKTIGLLKQPIIISVLSFIIIFAISTFFAVDKYNAFWGSLEKSEGLVGIVFFFSFFVYSLLVFEKKDWLWFLKLSLFVTLILLLQEFVEFFYDDISRPGSLSGNPIFLSGYLLFSIASALLIIKSGKNHKNKLWPYFSTLIIFLSIIGIFLTQTRGTILGLVLGIIGVLIYSAIKGKNLRFKGLTLKSISIGFLCLIIVFSLSLFLTRQSEIWHSVPGLSRVVEISASQDSTVSRLLSYESSLKSVNPITNGWKKTLIGWGPENFILADGKYYSLDRYKYESRWFDRSHNKLLDVLVMNGLFGLLAYLAIWFFYFKTIFLNKKVKTHDLKYKKESTESVFSLVEVALLFLGISFFTHLMFAFDNITTTIISLAVLGMVVNINIESRTEVVNNFYRIKITNVIVLVSGLFIILLSLFTIFTFLFGTLPAYSQMKNFFATIKNSNPSTIINEIEPSLSPMTNAQMDIRRVLLVVSNDIYNKKPGGDSIRLLNKALTEGDKYVENNPFDVKFLESLSKIYSNMGYVQKNSEYLKKAESYLDMALNLAPNRPNINYILAVNFAYQSKFKEAQDIINTIISQDSKLQDSYYYQGVIWWLAGGSNYSQALAIFESAFDQKPAIFSAERSDAIAIYTKFIQYFYTQKDQDSFIKVANRLKLNSYEGSSSLDQIVNYLNDTGTWPVVNFE